MTLQTRTLCCVLALAGCADRQLSDDDDFFPENRPTCMIVDARGYWEDGSSKPILNEEGSTPTVCVCMTQDEVVEETRVDELNELAYAECKRLERMQWDFDWTECQENYESGEWLSLVIVAVGDDDYTSLNRTGLDCDAEELAESCSIRPPDRNDPMLGLVFVVLLDLRRQRKCR